MKPPFIDIALFFAYLVGTPVLIFWLDLGGLAWLMYVSTLAIFSAISIGVADLRQKIGAT